MKVIALPNGDIAASGFRIAPDARCDGIDCRDKKATHAVTFRIITATNQDALGLYLACPRCAAMADVKSKVFLIAQLRRVAEPCKEGSKGPSPKTEQKLERLIEYLRQPRTTLQVAKEFRVTPTTAHKRLSELQKLGRITKTKITEHGYTYQVR